MLYRIDELTRVCDHGKYAAAAPLLVSYETLRRSIELSEKLDSPLIIRCRENELDFKDVVYWAEYYADKFSRSRISICAEDISSYKDAVKACMLGFQGIAISDSLLLNHEENIGSIREIVRIAHASNAGVQAALKDDETLTSREAYNLVKDTGVDIVKIITDKPAAEESLNSFLGKIQSIKKETMADIAIDEAVCMDVHLFAELKSHGVSKFDIDKGIAEKCLECMEEEYIRIIESGASRIRALNKIDEAMFNAFNEETEKYIRLAGRFVRPHMR